MRVEVGDYGGWRGIRRREGNGGGVCGVEENGEVWVGGRGWGVGGRGGGGCWVVGGGGGGGRRWGEALTPAFVAVLPH